ncbi:hypothetical protein F5Y10DRAFT_257017 [Nemania abortiva]|nr:hypothetical protein F5Y10DRAFT_257017 [Nemania abortiva]
MSFPLDHTHIPVKPSYLDLFIIGGGHRALKFTKALRDDKPFLTIRQEFEINLGTTMSEADPIPAEASTTAVVESCIENAKKSIIHLEGKEKEQVRNPLADLRLWADSLGATKKKEDSLDWRFRHRPSDIVIIRQVLSMLEGYLNDCYVAASSKSDVKDIIFNIHKTMETLAIMGRHIQRSGGESQLEEADSPPDADSSSDAVYFSDADSSSDQNRGE